MTSMPKVRVIIRLPYNRPEDAPPDPPKIEWTPEKENILWEVIARSRAADSGGTDWKGLAAHLQVPLPYLLYRAQTRYEQDLRGLQDITGALSPISAQGTSKNTEYFPNVADKPSLMRRASSRMGGGRLSSSTRLSTPVGARARLSSTPSRPYKTSSSSTITLRAGNNKRSNPPLSPPSPSDSSDGEGESDEEAARAEKAEREQEEQEALERKLQDLQRIITGDAIGLIRSPVSRDKGKEVNRGRIGLLSPRLQPADSSSRALASDRSQSLSSTGSPQGSIPSIPSPPSDRESRRGSPVPLSRHMSPGKSTSPPAVSHRSARGQSHMRHVTMPIVTKRTNSEKSSNHGSSASSFSDISEASLSSSAMESAVLSNIKSGGSRLSSFARSHFSGRKGMPL